MTGSRKVLTGAASNWIRFLITAIVSFVLIPIMAQVFGPERYGLWALASSILGLLHALDAGFGAGTVKWTAETQDATGASRRDELLSTSLAVHLAAGAVGSLIVLALLLPFPTVSGVSGGLVAESRWVLLFLGLRVTAVGVPSGFLRGILFGSDRLVLLNAVQILASLLYGGVSLLLLQQGAGPASLAAAGLIISVTELLILLVLMRRVARSTLPPIRVSLRLLSRARFREALSFSGASFSIQIAAVVLMQSDLILLRVYVPLTVVAGYGIAMRAGEYAFILVKQAVNALTPAIARLNSVAEPQKARFVVTNASKYSGALAAIFCVAAWVLGRDFLVAWTSVEYGRYWGILAILTSAFVVLAVQMPCAAWLSLQGHHKWAARAMIGSAGVNVVASLALGAFFQETGIALGTLTAAIVVDGVLLPRHAYRLLGLRLRDLVTRVWMRLILPAGAELAVLILLLRATEYRSVFVLIGMGAIGALAYFVVFWTFSIDRSERSLFLPRIGRRRQ